MGNGFYIIIAIRSASMSNRRITVTDRRDLAQGLQSTSALRLDRNSTRAVRPATTE
jgi:hypothetical protein